MDIADFLAATARDGEAFADAVEVAGRREGGEPRAERLGALVALSRRVRGHGSHRVSDHRQPTDSPRVALPTALTDKSPKLSPDVTHGVQ